MEWLGSVRDVDAMAECGPPLPADYLQQAHSLYSSGVLCEVVLLGEERAQIAAELNWMPEDDDGDSDEEEEADGDEDEWLPSGAKRLKQLQHPESNEEAASAQPADAAALSPPPSPSARHRSPLDLLPWLYCAMLPSSADRVWSCWCGLQPCDSFRVVRRHIREVHGGISDPPSPEIADGPDDSSAGSSLLLPHSAAMRPNVRVQLSPPPAQLEGRARTL